MNGLQRLLRGTAVLPIRFYRRCISPWKPATCRFHPTCSEYAKEAILLHGVGKGGWLSFRRICRCHPWGGFGCDPVPGSKEQQEQERQDTNADSVR